MSKMVLRGKKCSQNVQYGINWFQWSKMVQNGLKKIDHKLNRMAFIYKDHPIEFMVDFQDYFGPFGPFGPYPGST